MDKNSYKYVIIGSGLAGVSAAGGIREADKTGDILMAGMENNMPYDRPPLTKKLWTGAKKVSEIFLHDENFYKNQGIDLYPGYAAAQIKPSEKSVVFEDGRVIAYSKLLLATGGIPRKLGIPGGGTGEICYFRTLNDYQNIRRLAGEGSKALVIGGGFIGTEIAAALNMNKVSVTMVFPEEFPASRVFTEVLGKKILDNYREKGIEVLCGDLPVSIEKKQGHLLTKTKNGREIISDFIIAGIGIIPDTVLAQKAGLAVGNGITADENLRTSDPDIYTAGDNTNFISISSGERMRLEHWDNAIWQGKTAGLNMAGQKTPYNHIPYFFSDFFDFGFEAAGDINPKSGTISFWKKEFDTGIIYYMKDGLVRGVMLCNVWDKIDMARELIDKKEILSGEELKTAIVF
jgi:NADPH-dependent 2,4-dienoyl-CoA reductase/sulfur reductase-like enzyme